MIQQMGVSESAAQAFIGLTEGINLGVFNIETCYASSTTTSTIKEFAQLFAHV